MASIGISLEYCMPQHRLYSAQHMGYLIGLPMVEQDFYSEAAIVPPAVDFVDIITLAQLGGLPGDEEPNPGPGDDEPTGD